MIEYRFALAPLTRRDAYAPNIARSFDWTSKPRLDLPELPTPPEVVSVACGPSGDEPSPAIPRPAEHDLMDLVTSGYLERLGFDFQPASPDRLFRMPHTVAAAQN
jgi:phospholipase C